MQPAPPKTPQPRRFTWRRLLAVLALLFVASLATAAYLLTHLETPWLRDRVRRMVQEQLHIDVQYQQAAIGWSGLELRDFVLASLPPDRDVAPELLHIDRVSAAWRLRDFLPGHLPHAKLAVRGVALNVVMDTDGVTSVERLLAALPKSPEKPPTQLSQLFKALSDAPAFSLDGLEVHGVHARLVRRLPQGGDQHVYLGDLNLDGAARTGPRDPELELTLAGAPLRLETTDVPLPAELTPVLAVLPWLQPLADGSGVLPMELRATAKLAKGAMTVALRLSSAQQQFMELRATLTPEVGKPGLALAIQQIALVDWLTLSGALFVPDAQNALDGGVGLRLNLPNLKLPGVALAATTLTVALDGLHLALDPSATTLQKLELVLDSQGVTLPFARLGAVHATALARLDTAAALAGAATLTVADLNAQDEAGEVTATNVQLATTWQALPDAVTLTLDGRLDAQLRLGERSARLTTLTPHLQLEALGIAALLADPLAALRHLQAKLTVARADVAAEGATVVATDLEFGVDLPRIERESPRVLLVPQEAKIWGQCASVDVPKRRLSRLSFVLRTQAPRLVLDAPFASSGGVQLSVRGPVELDGTLRYAPDKANWDLRFNTHPAELVELLQPPGQVRKLVQWSRLQVSGVSQGEATHLRGLPSVDQHSHLTVSNLEMPQRAAVKSLRVDVTSDGQGLTQKAAFRLDADVTRVGRVRPGGALQVTGTLDHDPDHHHVALALEAKGPHQLSAGLKVQGHAQGRDLAYVVHGHARNLAAFLHALPDAERGALCMLNPQLSATLDVTGTLTHGAVLFDQQVPHGPEGAHALTLALADVRCKLPQANVNLPKLAVTADARWLGKSGEGNVRAVVADLDAAVSGHAVALHGLEQALKLALREDGTLHVSGDGKLARLTQDALPGVPMRELSWQGLGWSGPEGARLERFQLANPPSGTQITMSGGLDRAALRPAKVTDADVNGAAAVSLPASATAATEPVPGRLGLNITAELRQDLAALVHDNAQLSARGIVTIPIYVESGDLVVFHTDARLHFEHVDVALAKPAFAVKDIFGDVPLVEAFTLAPQFQLLGGGEDDAYARWRFAEHQPFLRRSDFLTIAQVRYGGAVMGPIAGNANVDHDVFRMDQLEATLLHGQLTGQCLVLLNGADTHIQLRGNATGLQVEGSDARFDANAALDFLPVRRALDGRAEILHMGSEHLAALLDLWDPYREDAQSNRLRTVLKIGHPERVRMRFQHGFMDVAVTLGGLSGAVQIDEVRGIALGPIFQRWLDPLLAPLKSLRVREAPKP